MIGDHRGGTFVVGSRDHERDVSPWSTGSSARRSNGCQRGVVGNRTPSTAHALGGDADGDQAVGGDHAVVGHGDGLGFSSGPPISAVGNQGCASGIAPLATDRLPQQGGTTHEGSINAGVVERQLH